jgi:hypothetical protein
MVKKSLSTAVETSGLSTPVQERKVIETPGAGFALKALFTYLDVVSPCPLVDEAKATFNTVRQNVGAILVSIGEQIQPAETPAEQTPSVAVNIVR